MRTQHAAEACLLQFEKGFVTPVENFLHPQGSLLLVEDTIDAAHRSDRVVSEISHKPANRVWSQHAGSVGKNDDVTVQDWHSVIQHRDLAAVDRKF